MYGLTFQGNIAYVPQEAWILSKTLKDNILLDKPELHTKYQEVLQKCTLNPDIKTLSHGDETEIGEKVRTLGSDNAVATHGDGMETGEKVRALGSNITIATHYYCPLIQYLTEG